MNLLGELKQKYEWIGDVRGRGLAAICYRCFELGLLVFYVGIHSNVIEITQPLTISKQEIDLAVSILYQAFKDLESNSIDMEKVKQYAGW